MYRFVFFLCLVSLAACLPRRTGRIVGGTDSEEGQFPHSVSLRNVVGNDLFCNGFLINERWIGTTYRCVSSKTPEGIAAVVGTIRLSSGGVTYRISQIVLNPDFRQEGFGRYENDIGLLQTVTGIAQSWDVFALQLGTAFLGAGAPIRIAAWGSTADNIDNVSDSLRFIVVRSITNEECKQRSPLVISNQITDRVLCTAGDNPSIGVCGKDTGAAVVSNVFVVGIVSFNMPCAVGIPDAHLRISAFRPWIMSIVN